MKKYLARSPSRSRRTISLAPRPESEPNGISQVRAKMATHTDTRVQRRVSQKANKPLGGKNQQKARHVASQLAFAHRSPTQRQTWLGYIRYVVNFMQKRKGKSLSRPTLGDN